MDIAPYPVGYRHFAAGLAARWSPDLTPQLPVPDNCLHYREELICHEKDNIDHCFCNANRLQHGLDGHRSSSAGPPVCRASQEQARHCVSDSPGVSGVAFFHKASRHSHLGYGAAIMAGRSFFCRCSSFAMGTRHHLHLRPTGISNF